MIIAAAIKVGNLIHFMPQPARHNDILLEMAKNGVPKPIGGEQGFVGNCGNFFNRESALIVALLNKQIKEKHGSNSKLYSEDIW